MGMLLLCSLFIFAPAPGVSLRRGVGQHAAPQSEMRRGDRLNEGDRMTSDNGQFRMGMQKDGNLVVRNAAGASIWSTGTVGKNNPYRAVLQSDGNFCVRAPGAALWCTDTQPQGYRIKLENDGRVAIRDADGSELWSTRDGSPSPAPSLPRRRRSRRRTRRRSGGGGGGTDPDFKTDKVVWKSSPPGAEVAWTAQANLVDKKKSELKVDSKASRDDYEVMILGVSTGDQSKDKPQDGDDMKKQGFRLIGAEGDGDKKIEMWIRKNEGRGAITICKPCGLWGKGKEKGGMGCGWGVMTISGSALDLGSMKSIQWTSSHKRPILNIKSASSRNGLQLLAVFFDDSVEILSADNGDIALVKGKFGDGDGIGLVAWQPGKSMPSTLPLKEHDGGGNQFTAISVNIEIQ